MNSLLETCCLICVALLQVKYKEKYEKEKGKAMLDFETPTYVSAKEAQHMQSQVKTLLLFLLLLFRQPFPKSVGNVYSLLINLYCDASCYVLISCSLLSVLEEFDHASI